MWSISQVSACNRFATVLKINRNFDSRDDYRHFPIVPGACFMPYLQRMALLIPTTLHLSRRWSCFLSWVTYVRGAITFKLTVFSAFTSSQTRPARWLCSLPRDYWRRRQWRRTQRHCPENCPPFTTTIPSITISDFSSFVVLIPSPLSFKLSSVFATTAYLNTVSNAYGGVVNAFDMAIAIWLRGELFKGLELQHCLMAPFLVVMKNSVSLIVLRNCLILRLLLIALWVVLFDFLSLFS